MPIPVTCAKCGYLIQAPDHVAGRTLRCFKCMTPFNVPKLNMAPVAPMAMFAPSTPVPAPMAVLPSSPPPAAKAPQPEAAPEFELDAPLLLDEPAAKGKEAAAEPDIDDLPVLDEPKAGDDAVEELPATDDVAWEEEPKPDAKSKKKKAAAVPAGDGAALFASSALMQEQAYVLKHNISLFRFYKFSLLRPGSKELLARGKERINFMRAIPVIGSFFARVVEFREEDKGPVLFTLRIRKPFLSFTMNYEVFDEQAKMLGYFKSKIFANILTGGGFWVYDAQGQQVAETKNQGIFSMNARAAFITTDGRELGAIVDETLDTAKKKKFAVVFMPGWVLKVSDEVQEHPPIKILLIAAALAMEIKKSDKKSGP
jgi:hypothetical protein